MKHVRAFAEWVQRHALCLLLIVIGAWTGAFLIRRRDNAVTTLNSARSVDRAKARIATLRAKSATIAALDQDKANELLRVHSDIEQHKRAIAEIYNGKPWSAMTDAEALAALKAAGV